MKRTCEIVLTNGVVYTVDQKDSLEQAIAIDNGKIVFVGKDKDIGDWIGENTKIIDLGGKFVMPGIFDAHCHLPQAAISRTREIDLFGVVGKDNVLQTIREYVEKHKEQPYYLGLGYARTDFDEIGPLKEWLDDICPDKPMWLTDSNGHSCWLNSKAFEAAGITKETPNPEGGVFQKHPVTKELTGTVSEDPAIFYSKRNVPKYSKEDYKEALLWGQQFFNERGVTSIYDASLIFEEPEVYQAYQELAEEGKLTLRVRAGWYISSPKSPEEMETFIHETLKVNQTFNTPYFKPNSVKILRDGTVEEQTAYMSEPYLNKEEGYRGEPSIAKENFWMMLEKLEYNGLQVHIHQCGDAVAEEALDMFEGLEAQFGKRDRRHTLAHCQCLTAKQIVRMGKLGMCGVAAPDWAISSPDVHYGVYLPSIGREWIKNMYLLNSMKKAGIVVGYHSDFYVSEPNLGSNLYSALTRAYSKEMFDFYFSESGYERTLEKVFFENLNAVAPLPPYDEVLTLPEALRLMTLNGAYVNFMEHEVGSIEEGKFADIIVLDQNPFELLEKDIEEISDIRPVMTIFDGKIVYNEQQEVL